MAKTYEPIATTTLSSAASSVTFSSISGSYTDLVVIISALGNVGSPTDYGISLQINGDASGGYSDTWLYGNGTSAVSSRRTNQSSIVDIQAAGYLSTTSPNPCVVNFLNYSNTTTYKTSLSRSNSQNYVSSYVGLWRSTSAISTVTLTAPVGANWSSTTTATLYGIKAA